MKEKLIIIGAGGHGRVVYDAAVKSGRFDVIGFADAAVKPGEEVIDGCKVIATQNDYLKSPEPGAKFIVAIGNNAVRRDLFNQLSATSEAAVIVHPEASLGIGAKLGAGTVLLARAVVNAGATIGKNCIINCFSLVDHDTVVEDHVHVERGSLIGPSSLVKSAVTTIMGKSYASSSQVE